MDAKSCTRCSIVKGVALFPPDKRAKDGRASECRTCFGRRTKAWREANPIRQQGLSAAWIKRNLDYDATVRARRRAEKFKATPLWADAVAIRDIYEFCKLWSEVTGIKHHVDHEIPLKHDLVCGLHVDTNLRVITAKENIAKHNYWEV